MSAIVSDVSDKGHEAGRMSGRRKKKHPIVDADVHPHATEAALQPYLPQRWREHVYGGRTRGSGTEIIRMRAFGARTDSYPPGDAPPGSDPEFAAEQLLDQFDIDRAILGPIGAVPGPPINPHLGKWRAHAVNEWLASEWLDRDPRWLASMALPYEQPLTMYRDLLDHWSQDPRFVQVGLLPVRTERPLGDVKYWDLYEALADLDLPLAIHPGNTGGSPVTGAGWPSYYFEDHSGYTQALPPHIASLVFSGTLDRFPALKIVIVEGGWSWVPAVSWRLDAGWRLMGDEVPALDRRPSAYLRDRFWYTSQPMEEPEKGSWFEELLDRSGIANQLMFSTDYPHWDFDSPYDSLPKGLSKEFVERLQHGNAQKLYGMEL